MDVSDWLRRLELAQYIPAFTDNAIDWAVLPTLTADDLRDLGVLSVAIAASCLTRSGLSTSGCRRPRRYRRLLVHHR
jgi:hypothetical protein